MRLSAHLAIILMLHNRIDKKFQPDYNQILRVFIESMVAGGEARFDLASRVQRIPFYVAMMLGEQDQRETYARVLLTLSKDGTSDDLSQKIAQANEQLFTEAMCTRILQSVP